MNAEAHARQQFSSTLGELSDITLDSPPNPHHAQLGDALLGYSALETQLANGSKFLGTLSSQFGETASQHCNVYLPNIHKLYQRYYKTARLYNEVSTTSEVCVSCVYVCVCVWVVVWLSGCLLGCV
jgi:hypothetical protein